MLQSNTASRPLLWREPAALAFGTGDRRRRVLVVEDDPVQSLLLTLMLDHLGVGFVLVTDGEQAVQAVQRGRFALILMDYQMPRLDGIEATRRIRGWERDHRLPATPIVAVTASAMADQCSAYLSAGMNDVMLKPFSAAKVADIVARYGSVLPQPAFAHGVTS